MPKLLVTSVVRKIQVFVVLHRGQNQEIYFVKSLKYISISEIHFSVFWFYMILYFKTLKDIATSPEKLMRN